jgi:hypothetical protein
MNASHPPRTYPFRPFISTSPELGDVDEFFLETGMVIIAPEPPMTGRELSGLDKVRIMVAFPENLDQRYEVNGEFSVGGFDDRGGEITICIYANNEVSEELRDFCVRVPVEFVDRVVTRYVPGLTDPDDGA